LGNNRIPFYLLPPTSRNTTTFSSTRCLTLIVGAVLSILIVVFLSSMVWTTTNLTIVTPSSSTNDKIQQHIKTIRKNKDDDDNRISYENNHQSSFYRLRNKNHNIDQFTSSNKDFDHRISHRETEQVEVDDEQKIDNVQEDDNTQPETTDEATINEPVNVESGTEEPNIENKNDGERSIDGEVPTLEESNSKNIPNTNENPEHLSIQERKRRRKEAKRKRKMEKREQIQLQEEQTAIEGASVKEESEPTEESIEEVQETIIETEPEMEETGTNELMEVETTEEEEQTPSETEEGTLIEEEVEAPTSTSEPVSLSTGRNLEILKVTLPEIETTLTHKLDILDSYINSEDAGAPITCTPTLNQEYFPDSFAQTYSTLKPLEYSNALKEEDSVKVWLSAGIDPNANNDEIVQRTRMGTRSLSKYCSNRQFFRPDHVPEGGCPGEPAPFPPTYNYPWCFPPTDPVHIMSIDCGIVENYIVHEDIAFTIFNDKVVVATDRERWKVQTNIPVNEYDELACMGAAEYPTEPGHFPNEDLHALLYLDAALPSRIPLLFPSGGIASHMFESLLAENLLNPNRTFIPVGPRHAQSYFRAKRLYFFRSNRNWGQAPFISWYGQRFVQQLIFPVIERRLQNKPVDEQNKKSRELSIVVMQRSSGSRILTNHNDLMDRLAQWIPDANIQAFVPGPGSGHPMWDTAERIYSSCLLIGPHGGNMPNELYLKAGCWVIEIGFIDPGFALPTDFYCFSRNLGQNYWLSIGDGSYSGGLVADLDDIGEIIQAYKREVLKRE